MEFKSYFIKTDVTAIRVFNNITFVGVGATLYVFNTESSKLITKRDIVDTRGEHIFGIIPISTNKILLYGGNFLFLFGTNQNFESIFEIRRTVLLDWILEAKPIDNETKIATVSMKNKIQLWDMDLNLLSCSECKERCILYSGHICYDNYERLIILSGTVFNEILIWKPSKSKFASVKKRLQKHEGVIFSLQYNKSTGLICSTSDDRSAVLWKVDSGDLHSELDKEFITISPICQVYGHLSRVFRCLILDTYFITAGEDSVVNIWTLEGELKRKVEISHGGPIWAIEYDPNQKLLLSGGSNGGVSVFSLHTHVTDDKICLPDKEKPKLISILPSNRFLCFTESGILFLHKEGSWLKVEEFEDLKSYILLKISKCRKLVALAGFKGQVYIYKVDTKETLQKLNVFYLKSQTRIISIHWLSCDLLLICQEEGILTLLELNLKSAEIKLISLFTLPPSSQRCSTSATIFDKNIVVGDRKGNIHMYKLGQKLPIQTITKVQSHLGVTNLIVINNCLMCLGRNGVIKAFSKNADKLTLLSSDKVPYSWLLDIIDDLLIAFSGNNFIAWNYRTKKIYLEKVCGGGHRSWDFYKNNNSITFMYIKDKFINQFNYNMDLNKSYDLIEPFHLKEVNCMSVLKYSHEFILISGGEDTTLRVTLTNQYLNDFKNLVTLKSHLSSIKCIVTHKLQSTDNDMYLIFSAGGRAQIVCWTLELTNPIQNLLCKENHSYYELLGCEESENRIMDMCVIQLEQKIILFAGCSDGYIKIFFVERYDDRFRIKLYKNVFYKLKCIFKVHILEVFDKNVLITLASDGNIVFWDINTILLNTAEPFSEINMHQSGINTFSKLQINSNSFLFLTAGDDNAVKLSYFKFSLINHSLTVQVIDNFSNSELHWAQITGSCITSEYFLTASVDQKVILYKWKIDNDKINYNAVTKHNSAVSDLKGLIAYNDEDFYLFIYGIGVEFLKLINK